MVRGTADRVRARRGGAPCKWRRSRGHRLYRGFPASHRVAARTGKMFSDGTDFLVMPTQAITAPQIDQQTVTLGGRAIDVLDTMIHFPCAFSITGLPALSVPMGLANGMPTGLQLIGPFLGDHAVLQAGLAMQQCATNPVIGQPNIASAQNAPSA
jgi:Asp-tRNA(Asn)/Glu-tRNA(Gln) amidotransferase A subunit family amidase